MLNCDNFVPRAYSISRQYRVFLRLLEILTDNCKSYIDNFVNLINPNLCPANMLPALASYVGYEYDYAESQDTNRMIIKHYPDLIRYRGSETGMKLATALSVTSAGDFDDLESLANFRIEYNRVNGKIDIYVYYPNYLTKIRDLIEVVRPAGVRVDLIPASPIDTSEKININDYVNAAKSEYLGSNRYKVSDDNDVGFGEVSKNNEKLTNN